MRFIYTGISPSGGIQIYKNIHIPKNNPKGIDVITKNTVSIKGCEASLVKRQNWKNV